MVGNVRTVANAIAFIESSAGSGSSGSVNGLPEIIAGVRVILMGVLL